MLRINLSGNPATSGGIGHLCDHTMAVYRPVEVTGEQGQVIRRYAPIYADVPCTLNQPSATLSLEHGGIVVAGGRKIYCDIGPVILPRDVCVVTGPRTTGALEVEKPDAPRGHHIELHVSEFTGKLALVEES